MCLSYVSLHSPLILSCRNLKIYSVKAGVLVNVMKCKKNFFLIRNDEGSFGRFFLKVRINVFEMKPTFYKILKLKYLAFTFTLHLGFLFGLSVGFSLPAFCFLHIFANTLVQGIE